MECCGFPSSALPRCTFTKETERIPVLTSISFLFCFLIFLQDKGGRINIYCSSQEWGKMACISPTEKNIQRWGAGASRQFSVSRRFYRALLQQQKDWGVRWNNYIGVINHTRSVSFPVLSSVTSFTPFFKGLFSPVITMNLSGFTHAC